VAPALDWDGDEAPVRNDDRTHGTWPWGIPVPEAVNPARGGGLQGGRADRKKAAAEAFVHAVRQGLLADTAAPGATATTLSSRTWVRGQETWRCRWRIFASTSAPSLR